MIEARFEVHGVGRRDPHARAIARLAPETQCAQACLGTRQVQYAENLPQRIVAWQVGCRRPLVPEPDLIFALLLLCRNHDDLERVGCRGGVPPMATGPPGPAC